MSNNTDDTTPVTPDVDGGAASFEQSLPERAEQAAQPQSLPAEPVAPRSSAPVVPARRNGLLVLVAVLSGVLLLGLGFGAGWAVAGAAHSHSSGGFGPMQGGPDGDRRGAPGDQQGGPRGGDMHDRGGADGSTPDGSTDDDSDGTDGSGS